MNKLPIKTRAHTLLQQGRLAEAKVLYEKAARSHPSDADTWHRLSAINGMLGLFEQSESCARKTIRLLPNATPAYNNLGTAQIEQGKVDSAQSTFLKALELAPNNPETLNNIGNTWLRKKEFGQAAGCYSKAIELNPQYAEAHNNLGNALLLLQRPQDAIKCLQTALQINPHYLDALFNYAKALQTLGQLQQALTTYQQVLQLKPDHMDARFGIGDLHQEQGEYDKAIECYEQLLIGNPENARLLGSLAGIKKDCGQIEEAIALYKKAVSITPEDDGLYSNFLFTLNYRENTNTSRIVEAHQVWGKYIAKRLPPSFSFAGKRDKKRITIGYVSHDFHTHSVAYFLEPILACHDRERFRIICYANMATQLEDSTTGRIRENIDVWRNITELSDSMAAQQIFDDNVDILIDLSGHTAWNRLPVFALRPAPIQISYLGYPNSTGLDTMDFRLTDDIADPRAMENANTCTEELVRLPHGFLTYQPPAEAPLPAPPPCAKNGFITFGSFNTLPKIGPRLIALWCQLLETVPESRLLVKNSSFTSPYAQDLFLQQALKYGADPQRITLLPPSPGTAEHLDLYGRMDIALDTFPYNGTTTTCEALWMGVPVVTFSGCSHASRVSSSILHRLELDSLVATRPQDYLDIARELATDQHKLERLRATLRQRFTDSAIGNSRKFTKAYEETLTRIYNTILP